MEQSNIFSAPSKYDIGLSTSQQMKHLQDKRSQILDKWGSFKIDATPSTKNLNTNRPLVHTRQYNPLTTEYRSHYLAPRILSTGNNSRLTQSLATIQENPKQVDNKDFFKSLAPQTLQPTRKTFEETIAQAPRQQVSKPDSVKEQSIQAGIPFTRENKEIQAGGQVSKEIQTYDQKSQSVKPSIKFQNNAKNVLQLSSPQLPQKSYASIFQNQNGTFGAPSGLIQVSGQRNFYFHNLKQKEQIERFKQLRDKKLI